MDRVRHAGTLAFAVMFAWVAAGLPGAGVRPVAAAAVAWPTSSLVVSEVQTGGASASDEFVEIANQGPAPVDLVGLEVVYATASGSTVTRKGTWPASTVLEPGRRFLLANAAGALATSGDATYSGGFAATGGAIALRVVGGEVVDAIGWGDAANAFVEGAVATAPPAGSSLERRPGGLAGNGTDTNDNASDWAVAAVPVAAGSVGAAGAGRDADARPRRQWRLRRPTPVATPTPTPDADSDADPGRRPPPQSDADPDPDARPRSPARRRARCRRRRQHHRRLRPRHLLRPPRRPRSPRRRRSTSRSPTCAASRMVPRRRSSAC